MYENRNPLVSVIIPVYNVESYLSKCLMSVINQNYKNLEIILVNDGSEDKSKEICEEYLALDSRIHFVDKENGGLSSARNAGLEIATGDFIQFVDSDDYLELNAISLAIERILKDKSQIVIYDYNKVDTNFNYIKNYTGIALMDTLWNKYDFWHNYYEGNGTFCVVAWNKLFSKDLLKNIRFLDGKIHEDEFFINEIIGKCDTISILNKKLYYYVQRNNSIMSTHNFQGDLDLFEALLKRNICLKKDNELRKKNIEHLLNRIVYCELNSKIKKRSQYYQFKKICNETYNISKEFYDKENIKKRNRLKFLKFNPNLYFYIKNKFLLSKLIKCVRAYFKFVNDKRLKELKEMERPVILFDTPIHGNIGDQAIALAERRILTFIYGKNNYVEFYNFEYKKLKIIKKYCPKNTVVYIHGGGFIGSLWENEHLIFCKALKVFKKYKIIVFPQTVFFYDNDRKNLNIMKQSINATSDLTICLRDKSSYEYMLSQDFNVILKYTPDIVFSLDYSKHYDRNNKVLLCLRKDHEKIVSNKIIIELLERNNLQYDITDTVVDTTIDKNDSEYYVNNKLDQFSKYSLVLCDRLHAMVFCSITGTPCIALDNISKKVSGVYSWIKKVDYIKCININDLSIDLINDMIKKSQNDGNIYLLNEFSFLFEKE